MKPVSPSAKGVAYLRYLEEKVSLDTLAKYFTDKEGESVAKRWLEYCPYVARTVAIRGRFIEDQAAKYINERVIKQMVNIAAGINTFPYRHEAALKLKNYIELDLPGMLEYKKTKIAELKQKEIITQKVSVDYIPIDLHQENLKEVFSSLPINRSQPVIFVFEGMSYYLPLKQLQVLFNVFSSIMPKGSIFIFDYFPEFVKSNEGLNQLMNSIITDGGEICLTYLSAQNIEKMLPNFNVISDSLEAKLEKNYFSDEISENVGSIVVAEKP